MYKYLCTQRPPAPGAIPSGAFDLEDYGEKKDGAWGWAAYKQPLTQKQIDDYELKPEQEA